MRYAEDQLDAVTIMLEALRGVPGVSDLHWVCPKGIVRPPSREIDELLAAVGDLMAGQARLDCTVGARAVTFIPFRSERHYFGKLVILSDEPDTFRAVQKWVQAAAHMVTTQFEARVTVEELAAQKVMLVTEIAERTASLRLANAALLSTANVVAITNEAGVIEWTNSAFLEAVGLESADVIGQNPAAIFKSTRVPAGDLATIFQLLSSGETFHGEIDHCRPNGEVRVYLVTVTPFRNEQGAVFKAVAVGQNVTNAKRDERRLRESEERHRVLFERMQEGCAIQEVITDAEGHFADIRTLAANAAIERHLGINPQWVIGRTFSDIFPDADKRAVAAFVTAAMTGVPQQLEYYSQRVKRHLRLRAFPGENGQFVSTFEDITERNANEVMLIAARKAADTANRAKSVFLQNMSHEIRTPLNGILGFTQLLKEEQLSPASTEYVDAITTSGTALSRLIDDLLDLSKIEADHVMIEQYAFSVRDCVADAARILRARVEDKRLTLHLAVASDVPAILVGDGRRISQVVLNLVGNAVKFTERGSVTVSVNVGERDHDTVMLEIIVADTGIGMSAEAMINIFEPFTQAEQNISRKFGGTGLGLAICRQLTDLMGGSLTCNSVEGRGSSFRALLPLSVVESGNGARLANRDTAPPPLWHGAALRVLLVEDHKLNQQLGLALLHKMGHTVVLASNGADALLALENGRFDLVLMDIRMPVMDGQSALTVLRAREAVTGTHTLVIAVTAFAMTGDASRFLAAGFDGYASKPLQVRDLRAEMQRVLATSPSHTESSP